MVSLHSEECTASNSTFCPYTSTTCHLFARNSCFFPSTSTHRYVPPEPPHIDADVEHENWDASTISSGVPSPVKSCNVIACSVELNSPSSKLSHSLLAPATMLAETITCSPPITDEEKHIRTMLTNETAFISTFFYQSMSPNASSSGAAQPCPAAKLRTALTGYAAPK